MIDTASLQMAVLSMQGPDSLADLGVAECDVRSIGLRTAAHLMCDHPHLMGVDDIDVILAAATSYGFELGLRTAALQTKG